MKRSSKIFAVTILAEALIITTGLSLAISQAFVASDQGSFYLLMSAMSFPILLAVLELFKIPAGICLYKVNWWIKPAALLLLIAATAATFETVYTGGTSWFTHVQSKISKKESNLDLLENRLDLIVVNIEKLNQNLDIDKPKNNIDQRLTVNNGLIEQLEEDRKHNAEQLEKVRIAIEKANSDINGQDIPEIKIINDAIERIQESINTRSIRFKDDFGRLKQEKDTLYIRFINREKEIKDQFDKDSFRLEKELSEINTGQDVEEINERRRRLLDEHSRQLLSIKTDLEENQKQLENLQNVWKVERNRLKVEDWDHYISRALDNDPEAIRIRNSRPTWDVWIANKQVEWFNSPVGKANTNNIENKQTEIELLKKRKAAFEERHTEERLSFENEHSFQSSDKDDKIKKLQSQQVLLAVNRDTSLNNIAIQRDKFIKQIDDKILILEQKYEQDQNEKEQEIRDLQSLRLTTLEQENAIKDKISDTQQQNLNNLETDKQKLEKIRDAISEDIRNAQDVRRIIQKEQKEEEDRYQQSWSLAKTEKDKALNAAESEREQLEEKISQSKEDIEAERSKSLMHRLTRVVKQVLPSIFHSNPEEPVNQQEVDKVTGWFTVVAALAISLSTGTSAFLATSLDDNKPKNNKRMTTLAGLFRRLRVAQGWHKRRVTEKFIEVPIRTETEKLVRIDNTKIHPVEKSVEKIVEVPLKEKIIYKVLPSKEIIDEVDK